jgi:hypothetical protein
VVQHESTQGRRSKSLGSRQRLIMQNILSYAIIQNKSLFAFIRE